MKQALHVLRTAIISWEVLGVLALVSVFQQAPNTFARLQKPIGSTGWLLVTPLGLLLTGSIGLAWKILFPSKYSSVLKNYPRYPQLRITTLCGVAYVGLGLATAAVAVIAADELQAGLPALLLCCGYYAAGLSFLSMLSAALTVRSLAASGI